ncbi:MAG: RNA polymerase sigma factor [Bacteroidales bacterium]|nr:RNA polymerase sigma factor [Bacteroidales bacterium]
MKEQELASACRKGDRAAFATLFEEYSPMLMKVCRRYTGNDNDAADVFQEGFAKIIEKFGNFEYRGEGSLKAWLVRVMMNCSVSFLRKRRRDSLIREPLEEDRLLLADSIELDENEVSRIPDDVLLDSVTELTPGCRTVFNMSVFEGLGHEEIGKILGIGKTASVSRLYRARKLLAERIKEYYKKVDNV